MERLEFSEDQPYIAIEAAIHLNRYLLAKPHCASKRVLDIACGEGYGAYLMVKRWGAAEVTAVDNSAAALARAQQTFAAPQITYRQHDAQDLPSAFDENTFDVIVSFETIEHVPDPEALLRGFRHVLRPDGIAVISCPNDWWYYPDASQHNPHHQRKYTFEEFRALCERILGPAAGFMLGSVALGFVNIPVASGLTDAADRGPVEMVRAENGLDALLTPTQDVVDARNCSYFVGIWSKAAPRVSPSVCTYPASMDASPIAIAHDHWALAETISALHAGRAPRPEQQPRAPRLQALCRQVQAIGDENTTRKHTEEELRQTISDQQQRERHAELRARAAQAEVEYLSEQIAQLLPARARVTELENHIAELRRTIDDQAHLVDERDAYIHSLETRINAAHTRLRALEARSLGTRLKRLLGRHPADSAHTSDDKS